jgi:glycosyltransferase involved in cell wall biosynthesis
MPGDAIFANDYMRVAVVHDWLNGMRGGEKVLESILTVFPGATIFTLFHERGKASPFIESHRVITSKLDRIPGIYRCYRNLLPLFPSAVESWDFSAYDLVISSSHAVAKGINPGAAPHICYCHTPMRYIWDAEEDYRMNPLTRLVFRRVRRRLRQWDCESAKRVTHFIANSRFVRDRIRRYYRRESDVVPPPVDTNFFNLSQALVREDFYLAAGALVPYKRFDVVIRAFNLLGKRLIVAGAGPELKKLRNMAASNIDIRGWVSNEELRRLYRTARALVNVAREDFGIVAVEAQSCGCPVIAYSVGGMAEIVREGFNGLLFAQQHEQDVIDAIERFETNEWPPKQVSERVERFARGAFEAKIRRIIESRIPEIAGKQNTPHSP